MEGPPEESQKRPQFVSPNLITPHSLNVAIRDSQLDHIDAVIDKLHSKKVYVKSKKEGRIENKRERNQFKSLMSRPRFSSKIIIALKDKWERDRYPNFIKTIIPTLSMISMLNLISGRHQYNLEPVKRTNVYPKILKMILQKRFNPCMECACCKSWTTMRDGTIDSVLINVMESFLSIRKIRMMKTETNNLKEYYRRKLECLFHSNSTIKTLFCIVHRLSILLDQDTYIWRSKNLDDKMFSLNTSSHYFSVPYRDSNSNPTGMIITSNDKSMSLYFEDEIYSYPRSYLLLIYNKLCDYLSVKILNDLSENEPYRPDDVRMFDPYINSLVNLAIDLDSDYFAISKSLEAICTGIDLIEIDGAVNGQFLRTLLDDLKEKTNHNVEFDQWYNIMLSCSLEYRNEISTLTKLMGHPFVKMEEGAAKLHKNTTEDLHIDPDAVLDVTRFAKKTFIKSYVEKNFQWPKLTENSVAQLPPHLLDAYLRNKDPEYNKFKYPDTSLCHYDAIEFDKNFELDYLTTFLPYLKDKTISDKKEEILKKMFRVEEIDGITVMKPVINHFKKSRLAMLGSTRLLFHYLISYMYELDHKSFVQMYESQDPALWKRLMDLMLIRIVPKEKELKELFRGFGCQSYMMRARCLVQETNMKRYLANYSDEQAMTLGELELKRKLKSLRNLHKIFRNSKIIYVNIDADKWNNKFRNQLVKPVCESTIDKLYSTTLYSLTHNYYENCFFYVPDGNKCYSWQGQKGGIEGLNQDTWVFVYINSIHYAMASFDMPYFILCKGDDLRIAVAVSEEARQGTPIEVLRRLLVDTVEKACLSVGQTIKKDDSYASESYFNFNKYASVGPIELPQSFRKIQKVYGENNAMRRGLDLYIAGAYSNGHSACSVSEGPVPCFITSSIWAAYYLCTNSALGKLSPNVVSAFLLIPNTLGGFPVIYLHNYFVRGESDLLSSFLNIMHFALQHNERIFDLLIKSLRKDNFSEEITLEVFRGLLADPYCLPTKKPSNADTILYQAIRRCLPKITKNEFILALLSDDLKKLDEDVVSYLYQSPSYDARIMSALYASSPISLLSEFIRKFETSRTIFDCLVVGIGFQAAKRMLIKSIHQEQTIIKWRLDFIQYNGTNLLLNKSLFSIPNFCPGKLADHLRNSLWKKQINSVTISPSTHFCDIINPDDNTTPSFDRDQENSFVSHYCGISRYLSRYVDGNHDEYIKSRNKNKFFSNGVHEPFIGTRTNLGLVSQDATFIKNNIYISKIQDLLDLHSWCIFDTSSTGPECYANLIREFMRFYIEEVDLDTMLPFGKSARGGTIQHHVRTSGFKEQIIPNTLNNHYTLFLGSSDSHRYIKTLNQHMNLNFMHVFATGVQIIMFCPIKNVVRHNKHEEDLAIVTPNCEYCYLPVTSGRCTSTVPVPDLTTQSLFLRTLFPKYSLDILSDSLVAYEKSTKKRLVSSIRKIQSDVKPDAAYIIETCMNEKMALMHVLQRYNLSKTRHQDMSTLEGLSGITLTKTSGLTEFKRINFDEISNLLDCLSINTMHERSIEIRSFTFEEYLEAEYYGLLPYHWLLTRCFQSGRFTEYTSSLHYLAKMGDMTSPNIMLLSKHITLAALKTIRIKIPVEIYVNTKDPSKSMRHCIEMYLRSTCHYILSYYSLLKYNVRINSECPIFNSLKNKGVLSSNQIDSTVLTFLLFCNCHYHFLNVERLEEACDGNEPPTLAMFYEYSIYSLSEKLLSEWMTESSAKGILHLFNMYTSNNSPSFSMYTEEYEEYNQEGYTINDIFRADCINAWLGSIPVTICEYSMDQVIMSLRKRKQSPKININENVIDPGPLESSDISTLMSSHLYIQKIEFSPIPNNLDVTSLIDIKYSEYEYKECLTGYYNSQAISIQLCRDFVSSLIQSSDSSFLSQMNVIMLNDHQGYLTTLLYPRFHSSYFYYFTEESRYQGLSELLYNPMLIHKDNPRNNSLFLNSLESTVCMASSTMFKTNIKPLTTDMKRIRLPTLAFLPWTRKCTPAIIDKILTNLSSVCLAESIQINYVIIEVSTTILHNLLLLLSSKLMISDKNMFIALSKHPTYTTTSLIVLSDFEDYDTSSNEELYISPNSYNTIRNVLDQFIASENKLPDKILKLKEKIDPGFSALNKIVPDFSYDVVFGISPSLYSHILNLNVSIDSANVIRNILQSAQRSEQSIRSEIRETEDTGRPIKVIRVPDISKVTRYVDSTRTLDDTWDSLTRTALASKYHRLMLLRGFQSHVNFVSISDHIYAYNTESVMLQIYRGEVINVSRRMFPKELPDPYLQEFTDGGFVFSPGVWFFRGVHSSMRLLSYLNNKTSDQTS